MRLGCLDRGRITFNAMRNAGFHHTLTVDARNWGQDWQLIMRNNEPLCRQTDSGILRFVI